jgi:GT2 family glycosyltransferase
MDEILGQSSLETGTLSLIVCTYGRPLQIRSLLQSTLKQTRQPDEILIVDASPDATTEEVTTLIRNDTGDQRIKYYRVASEDRGLTRQRNYGIARTRGGIVAFLDDDTVPEPDYFAELAACFDRRPDTVGVGGYIVNEVQWDRVDADSPQSTAVFRTGGWQRREDYRWRLRKMLKLASTLPPGWMPPSGHARPIGFLPPDDSDYEVEFVMGGASAWRREVFERHQFSPYFEGYGLYEDLDFCIRASREGKLHVCTRARLAHEHAPSARPNSFRYGEMVTRNGWFVWRRRWPQPSWADRMRWWATTALLSICRLGDTVRGPMRSRALAEAMGRFWGMTRLLGSTPETTLRPSGGKAEAASNF